MRHRIPIKGSGFSHVVVSRATLQRFFTIVVVVVAANGCGHKRPVSTYRLMTLNHAQVLIPPEVSNANLTRRTLVAKIPAGTGSCTRDGEAVQLEQKRGKIRITIDRDALFKQAPGWLSDWGMRQEIQGCVGIGSGRRLAMLVAESVPLDSATIYRLLENNDMLSGYVDIEAGNRLKVNSFVRGGELPEGQVSPGISKVADGSGQVKFEMTINPKFVGFETTWYTLTRNVEGLGHHFVPISTEQNIQGKVKRLTTPTINYFSFSPQADVFRLIYKSEENGVTAIVIAGTTREDLNRRTKVIGDDVEACKAARGMCIALPRGVGVNPFLVVNANGAAVPVPLGATVFTAIQEAGVENPETVLPKLTVNRLFRERATTVEFDRNSREIFNLELIGGEQISWQ